MPVWKSREGKVPAAQWMADFLTNVKLVHGVIATRALIEKLHPYIVEQWQQGATVREVVKALFICKPGELQVSPAVRTRLLKGELQPPKGAKRGDLFGFDELRKRGAVEQPAKAATPQTPRPSVSAKPRKTAMRKRNPPPPVTPQTPSADVQGQEDLATKAKAQMSSLIGEIVTGAIQGAKAEKAAKG